jgi:LCP family protein required for cell wall assembly
MRNRLPLIIAISIGVTVGLLTILGIFLYFSYRSVVVKPNSPTAQKNALLTPTAIPTPTPDPDRDFGIMLLGYGGGGHQGGYLTDTMILAYFQPKKQKITLFNIPRDLWIPLQTKEDAEPQHFKINAAYAIGKDDKKYPNKPVQYTGDAGGGVMSMDAVKTVTDLNIEHFATLSFAGFKKSIDTLGGVDVKVPETFDDFFYPIEGEEENTCGFSPEDIATAAAGLKGDKLEQFYTCRYEQLHFDQGVTHMDGETALKFVRSRHSAQSGGDFARSNRQKALILAIKEQIFNVGFIPKMVPFITSLRSDFQTDIDLNTMSDYISRADEFRSYQIKTVTISTDNVLKIGTSSDRQSILMPKEGIDQWDGIHQFIQDQLNEVEATPTAKPSTK